MMARKELFDIVGFFDSVRIAADDEFLDRMTLMLTGAQWRHLPLPLCQATVRPEPQAAGDRVGVDAPTEARQDYARAYRAWHRQPVDHRLEFPLRNRSFPAPAIAVPGFGDGERITASMATFPPRLATLDRVVARIVPQVDLFRIHLNNFESVPGFLRHEKIRVTRSQEHGDLRDNGKFLNMHEVPDGFHLTVDDDIAYPRNYARYMVAKVLQYDRRAVVGVHAAILQPGFGRYHDGVSRRTWSFRQELGEDVPVHVLGTGTVAYHTSAIDFGLERAGTTGMIDLWLAKAAQEQGVAMIAVARGRNYLREIGDHGPTSIFEQSKLDDSRETEFVRTHGPWRALDPIGRLVLGAD